MSMALDDKQQDNDDHPQLPELAEPRSTAEVAEALQASGMVDELLAQIDSGQVQVTGDGGLIPGLIKLALERGLKAELTDHLGYEKGDPAGRELPNARNGSTPKTVASEAGPVELKVPRDRDGTFTPRLVPKGSRRLGGLDDIIISLYAGGMTLRDIQHHLAATVGTDLSHETISKICDEVCDAVDEWQSRPLEALYPVLYLDALVVKVKDGAHVRNKHAHIAIGVDMAGVKHVLGIWIQAEEGAKFWAGVCAELANRGVKDVLIVCCDGLSGFPEAIEATWSGAIVQTSSVHPGGGQRVWLVVCAAAGRTYANASPSRSTCRPVHPWRGRPELSASGSSTTSAEMRFRKRAGHARGARRQGCWKEQHGHHHHYHHAWAGPGRVRRD